jgi:excisionase family DNA binding protein
MSKPLNVEEAAAFLGVTERALENMVLERKIPFYKPLPKKRYFRQEDLEAFCYRNRVSANYELKEEAEDIIAEARARRNYG